MADPPSSIPTPSVPFTHPDAWCGGYFEMDMDFPRISTELLRAAAVSLWRHQDLWGPWEGHHEDPQPSQILDLGNPALDLTYGGVFYGFARVPGGKVLPCFNSLCIGSDYMTLQFGVGMSALSHAWPVGAYPFDDGTPTDWVLPFSQWLADLARTVHHAVPLAVAVIGWEGNSGEVERFRIEGVPDSRWVGYLAPDDGELRYYPPTILTPPMT